LNEPGDTVKERLFDGFTRLISGIVDPAIVALASRYAYLSIRVTRLKR
jgi:hypothetical protein